MAHDLSDDRAREYYSLGTGGLHLDWTFVDPDFGNSYEIDWWSRIIIGPTLQVGAVMNLDGPIAMSLATLSWFGSGTGTAKVEAQESVTVPAGTFSTYRIRIQLSHSLTIDTPYPGAPNTIQGSDDTRIWLAKGIGIVKQSKTSVSSYFGTQTGTLNLKSYQLARELSGHVRRDTTDGPALAGISVKLASGGSQIASKTTDANGRFAFAGLSDGDYTVTPVSSSYAFAPESATVSISGDTELVPFVGELLLRQLSGFVRKDSAAGPPLVGVAISLSSGGSPMASTTTDASGYYSFQSLSNGTYTLTPTLADYTFAPALRTVTISGDLEVVPFIGTSTVTPRADLVSGSGGTLSPPSLIGGENLTVGGSIQNDGPVASGDFQVTYYLSSDGAIDVTDTVLGAKNYSALGASAIFSFSEMWAVPGNTAPGAYFVCWELDSAGTVEESDETNNSGHTTGTIAIVPQPTMTVVMPNGGESLKTGSAVSLTWGSSGNLAGNVMLDLMKGGAELVSISTGTPDDGQFEWTVPAWALIGTNYRIRACSVSNPSICDMSDGIFSISQSGLLADATDTDGDGMPDTWEDENLLNRKDFTDALLDWDGDGIASIDEFQTGTDPEDAASLYRLQILPTLAPTSGSIELSWLSAPGFSFALANASSLNGGWNPLPNSTILASESTTTVVIQKNSGSQGEFFRVVGASSAAHSPVFERHPVSRTANIGDGVGFSVLFAGAPFADIEWEVQPSGTASWLKVSNDQTFTGASTSDLRIRAAEQSMSGNRYRCVVRNSAGTATSAEASLSVFSNPGDLVNVSEIVEVLKLENLALENATIYLGQTLVVSFDIRNTSARRIVPAGNAWIGVEQTWIERLGPDKSIPQNGAGRDGDRYAAGGGVLGGQKNAGESWHFERVYDTSLYPMVPGTYRFYVDFKEIKNNQQIRRQHSAIEFEIVTVP